MDLTSGINDKNKSVGSSVYMYTYRFSNSQGSFDCLIVHANMQDSYHTVQMHSLILVFHVCTCHKVTFARDSSHVYKTDSTKPVEYCENYIYTWNTN